MFDEDRPPIEKITDEVEFAKRFVKASGNCSYFVEQFFGEDNHDYNIPYLNCEDRFVVYRSGRQCGKTRNAALKAIHFGYFAPLKKVKIRQRKCSIVIASITKDQAAIIFDAIVDYVGMSSILSDNVERQTKTELVLRWYNGGGKTRFVVRPIGDTGKSLRGYTTHLAILDEAGYIPEVVYNAFLPSTLTTKARILLTSTPKGKAGQFFKACQESHTIYEHGIKNPRIGHEDKKKNKWIQFHVTSYDNPDVQDDPEILEIATGGSEAQKKQELMGEFLDGGNSLIPYDMLQLSLNQVKREPEFLYYYLGVDTSGKGKDETVLTTIGVTDDGILYPVDMYVEETTDQTDLARKIQSLHRHFQYSNIYIDSTGIGDTLLDVCSRLDSSMPTYAINFKTDKLELYKNLARIFNDKLINLSLLEDYHKTKMADQLSYMYWDYGEQKDQTPKARSNAIHDDYPDSLALGAFGEQTGDFIQAVPMDIFSLSNV